MFNLKHHSPNSAHMLPIDNTHHTMIVTILILECAWHFYASLSKPTINEALDKAYSQYQASNTYDATIRQFSAPPKEYSILNYTEFILNHHLL